MRLPPDRPLFFTIRGFDAAYHQPEEKQHSRVSRIFQHYASRSIVSAKYHDMDLVMNVHDLYEQQIKSLSAADRLRLAVLILNDIPPQSVVDASDSWSEDDLQDFAQASWQHIDQNLDNEEDA